MTTVRSLPGVDVRIKSEMEISTGHAKYYEALLGRTIREIYFFDCEGDVLPTLILDNEKQVAVLRDPEGNGPGHLDIS